MERRRRAHEEIIENGTELESSFQFRAVLRLQTLGFAGLRVTGRTARVSRRAAFSSRTFFFGSCSYA